MTKIFNSLDLVRLGYKFKINLGINLSWDDMYGGYLIIFYHLPRLDWSEPIKQEFTNTDEIPF